MLLPEIACKKQGCNRNRLDTIFFVILKTKLCSNVIVLEEREMMMADVPKSISWCGGCKFYRGPEICSDCSKAIVPYFSPISAPLFFFFFETVIVS